MAGHIGREALENGLYDLIRNYCMAYQFDPQDVASVLITIIAHYALVNEIKPEKFRSEMQSIVLQYRDLYEGFKDRTNAE